MVRVAFGMLVAVLLPNVAFAQLDDATVDDYSQWKLALTSGGVAQPVSIAARPGFQVEVVRIAGATEGSWISLTFDPKGRLVVGREDKGLLRMTLAADGRSVEAVESIEETLLEPRGVLFAHGALYVHANNSKGLYRLRDTDGDDRFDEVTLLRKTEGAVGHGRNGLALGPDGMIYMAMGNNVEVPKDVAATSPYRNYGLDRLLPCVWNEFLFDAEVTPPAGYIARTDKDGKTWELFAGGFRNPYDLAFNADGELFTYDADMEWDAGAPWYRPTTVMHVVSGGEYGWRQGTSVWPDGFADSLPRIADIGLGSPTGVVFGTGTKFPDPYRSALFVLDWAYGRIIAVHLTPKGASYAGRAETFLKGKPLNVTDAAVGPDGALYFTVGGRRTQSVLYRVKWTGKEEAVPAPDSRISSLAGPQGARRERRNLEAAHRSVVASDTAWITSRLGSLDPWIRHAARVALERIPVAEWKDQAFDDQKPLRASTSLLAMARVGGPELRKPLLDRLASLSHYVPTAEQRIVVWRAAELAILRMGSPAARETAALLKRLESDRLAESFAEHQVVCELLVHLKSPAAAARALDLFDRAKRQEEKLFALYVLRNHTAGWTDETRRRYFEGLKEAEQFSGAQYMARYVTFIRTDALATLTDAERKSLAPVLSQLGKPPAAPPSPPPRPLVRAWTMDDVVPQLGEVSANRDPLRGKPLFAAARCRDCHRLGGEGSPVGPDLAGIASRFSRRDLLETILLPSKVVDEKYRSLILETVDGEIITGGLAGGDAETLAIAVNPQEPTQLRRIPRKAIEARKSSPVSPMPEGLLNTLTREEILDLLAYLEAASVK